MIPLQDEKSTQFRILEVASKLFAEKGYANVSVRDVCKYTNTTPPMIYYYFGSKKGLFNAVVRKNLSMKDFISRLEGEVEGKEPREAVKSFISFYLESFPDNAFEPGLYLSENSSFDKLSAKRIIQELDRIDLIATSLVKKCIESGVFIETDPSLAADCLLGMLNRVIFQRIHFAKVRDTDSYKQYIADFFFRALERR